MIVPTIKYCTWVNAILVKQATEIKKEELGIIFNKCLKLLFYYKPILSKNDIEFLIESIKSKKLPTPTLLIKDHKEKNQDGEFPCRLVIPATNFTSGFLKFVPCDWK